MVRHPPDHFRANGYGGGYGDILSSSARTHLARTIAKRHTREEYRQWVEAAGFEVTRQDDSTYHGAVMLVHARKRA